MWCTLALLSSWRQQTTWKDGQVIWLPLNYLQSLQNKRVCFSCTILSLPLFVCSDVRKQLASVGHINQSELVDKIKKVLDILAGNAPNTQSTLKTTSISRSTSASSTPGGMSSDDRWTPTNTYLFTPYTNRASVLVDLCQLAMEHNVTNLAAECITNVPYDVQVCFVLCVL